MRTERLVEHHRWWRIADPGWADPLDTSFAAARGGRWNPPDSYPVLYLNEDLVTARLNLRLFIAGWPYEPEDLRADNGPCLIGTTLPRSQRVADVHSRAGVAAAGLPPTYPTDATGQVVPHPPCQAIGVAARARALRGVRCRSARAPDGAGRELAWFPASRRSRATLVARLDFDTWYWS